MDEKLANPQSAKTTMAWVMGDKALATSK
jgi:hypothetical protein